MAKEYIEREALIEQVNGLCVDSNEYWIGNDNISFVAHADVVDIICDAPTADVVEVVPELRKTVELLHNEYEKAKQLDFVYDPLAYAVYQVWKAVDGRRKNGR